MRNLVIDELMKLINDGVEVYHTAPAPITDRKDLEALSNQELLDILIDSIEFQG